MRWNVQVDKAMKTLSRKLVAGQMLKDWKKRAYFVRPAEQRVLDQKETDKRLAKKRFKATMNAIMARRAQCVADTPGSWLIFDSIMQKGGTEQIIKALIICFGCFSFLQHGHWPTGPSAAANSNIMLM